MDFFPPLDLAYDLPPIQSGCLFFFEEEKQQMELLNNSQVVIRVVDSYHRLWSQTRALH